jgi:hypothetical protein
MIYNTFKKFNTHGKLRPVVLGSYFFPEYFSKIKNPRVRNPLMRMAEEINDEEATFIKETFVSTYNLRELTLLPVKNTDIGQDIIPGNNIASDHYDPTLLLDIYRHL